MSPWLAFLLGAWLGAALGVLAVCLAQAGSIGTPDRSAHTWRRR